MVGHNIGNGLSISRRSRPATIDMVSDFSEFVCNSVSDVSSEIINIIYKVWCVGDGTQWWCENQPQ